MSQILTHIKEIEKRFQIVSREKKSSDIEEQLEQTDNYLKKFIDEIIEEYSDPKYWESLKYSMNNKQNYERAHFVRLGYEIHKSNWRSIKYAMVSVEFRYASLVVTDDIFDNNEIRMNKRSVPLKEGKNNAISLASILKSLSSIALNKQLQSSDVSIKEKINIKDEISHLKVYEGQLMDILSSEKAIHELDQNFYINMIQNTTGEDVAYCFELGSLLAGFDEKKSKFIKNFGLSLGTAMQLRDDLLDYIDNYNVINKAPFCDFNSSKIRLPLVLAYKFADEEEKEKLLKIFTDGISTKSESKFIIDSVFNENVITYLRNIMGSLKLNMDRNLKEIDRSNEVIMNQIQELLDDVIVI